MNLVRFGKVSDPPQTYICSRLNGTDAGSEESVLAAIEAHRDVVARETLAVSLVVREADEVVVELEVAGA